MLGDSEETGENGVKTQMEGFDLDRRNPSSFGRWRYRWVQKELHL